MAGFFGKIKNTGIKAKLQGECTMIDREMKARKFKFGVELYDLLREQETSAGGNVMSTLGIKAPKGVPATPGSFKGRIQEHWDKVREDISELERKQEAMRVEKTHEEVRRERGVPAISAKEKIANAGGALQSHGKETKLMAQIALIDRDIKKRKEQFGVDVYMKAVEIIDKKGNSGLKSGVKNVMRGGLMKVSEHEQKIQRCVENAARDVGTMERSKETRLKEIDALEEEGGTLSFRKNSTAEI